MATGDTNGVLSPSLVLGNGEAPAYELKFLLDEAAARQIEGWARSQLAPDPHGEAALGGAYRTTSLYSDTPELAVYNRMASYRRRKFRVRRYGDHPGLFLERKSRWGDRVAKRRTAIHPVELAFLAEPDSDANWAGHWFHRRLTARRLGPACRVAYTRLAFVGVCPESPLRLTLDRELYGVLAQGWSLAPVENGLPLLNGKVIVEFKYRLALPLPFKELVADLRLTPAVVSKYRLCREAWGATRTPPEAAHA
jgi:hypothetical protein